MGLAEYAEIYRQDDALRASNPSPPDHLSAGSMTPPSPISPAARLEELWKRIAAILESDEPLPSRIAGPL